MPAAVETRFQPDPRNCERQIFRNQTLAHRKHVGIIVLPRETRRLFAPAKRATYAMDFIGHHRFAVPGTAEYDAALTLTAGDRFCRRANEKRIIHRFFVECAEVLYLMSKSAEQFFDFFFVTKTGVIGAERNFHAIS